MDERHPDDLSPDDVPSARALGLGPRVPKGLLWGLALAVVVLVIMSWVTLQSGTSSRTPGSGDVVRLTPGATVGLPGANAMLGQPAPTATYETWSGGSASLADHTGTPLVVNFWNSDCTPCVNEMPMFERVHQRYGDKVAFVGLDVVDRDDAARALAQRTGVTYPLGFDRNGIVNAAGVVVLPTTLMIDRNGTIVVSHPGEMHEDELVRAIDGKLQP